MDDEPDLVAELAATVKNAVGNVLREKGLYSEARDATTALQRRRERAHGDATSCAHHLA